MNKMPRIALNNGVQVPLLGLGTFLLKSPEVIGATEAALNLGYRLIGPANQGSEKAEISALTSLSNLQLDYLNLYLIHWPGSYGMKPDDLKNAELRKESWLQLEKMYKEGPANQGSEKAKISALTSLSNLQLDYLDLYLIHWPGSSGMKPDDLKNAELRKESWLKLEEMYKEGKFKAIGISNYTKQHIQELLQYCSVVPAVLQIEVHPYLTQKEIRKFCNEKGIHIQAYSSLGSRSGCKELMSDPAVVQIALNHNKTCAQVLLRWAIDHGMSVIPKTQSTSRLKENSDLFDFSLTQEELQKLDNLDKQNHFCWNPKDIK
ncbi:glyoxal reductase [Parasteatoda tepidariorum]|uniref:glyoxal reductase n=1 Tax=Parasteatoda tepidariorum TaxID=114398 RepID=UPI0039BCDC6E